MTTITITLPDELATKAQEKGLLTDESLAEMLERELQQREEKRRQAWQKLIEMADALQSLEPEMTLEEFEAEIEAGRNEFHAKQMAEKARKA